MEDTTQTFEQAWALKEAAGYKYGKDALEQVRMGWNMAREASVAESASAPYRPCTNCGVDSTGKMTHCFGCPNDPETFKAPASAADEWQLVPRKLTKQMRDALLSCESGEFSTQGGWDYILAAAPSPTQEKSDINPAEALYGFAGWLTSRGKTVTFGSTHEASTAAELVEAFCKSQGLEPPRPQFAKNLKPYPTV